VDDNTEVAMVAMLSASLALVRPVGMAANETSDWLEVALDAVSHLPLHIFEMGVRAARQTCTHHSQIIPTIIAETREPLNWYNRAAVAPPLRLVSPAPIAPAEPEPLPAPETLMPALRRMGLQKGWLVSRGGKLEWAEDAA